MSRLTAIICAAIFFLLASLAWAVSYYRDSAINYKDQRDKVTEQLRIANATIADIQMRQREVAALDAKYAKELTNAKAENDALQRRLDRGGRVLVAGNCPKQSAITSSVDHGATVELSPVAARNLLGIRSGIKSDQLKIMALQQYITEQCLR